MTGKLHNGPPGRINYVPDHVRDGLRDKRPTIYAYGTGLSAAFHETAIHSAMPQRLRRVQCPLCGNVPTTAARANEDGTCKVQSACAKRAAEVD